MNTKKNVTSKNVALSAIVLLVLLLSGCSMAPKLMNMVPPNEGRVFKNTSKTMKVEAPVGGKESDPLWEGSKIDNATFFGALITTLEQSNLFTKVNPSENPDYLLNPLILSQDQPSFGLNMTVKLFVRYTLSNNKDGSQIWQKDIPSSYTATVGDAFVAGVRVRKANEGVVRENFKALLNELAATNFE